jgi:Fur family ferric uptake transcriptional regulator
LIFSCRRVQVKAAEERFGEFLRSRGLKFTPERRSILRAVFSLDQHFDAEVLHGRLRKKGKRISLATIYRVMPLLVESGMIRETLRRQRNITYEHIYGHKHHDHLVCMICGKTIEFFDEELERRKEDVCEGYGFEPTEHWLTVRGVCSDCQGE